MQNLTKKIKHPNKDTVLQFSIPRSYLIGWYKVGLPGGDVEARELADKWLSDNKIKT